jgi:hypothetical protein
LGLSIDALPTQPAVDQLLKGIARATDRRLPAAGSTFLLERSAGRLPNRGRNPMSKSPRPEFAYCERIAEGIMASP